MSNREHINISRRTFLKNLGGAAAYMASGGEILAKERRSEKKDVLQPVEVVVNIEDVDPTTNKKSMRPVVLVISGLEGHPNLGGQVAESIKASFPKDRVPDQTTAQIRKNITVEFIPEKPKSSKSEPGKQGIGEKTRDATIAGAKNAGVQAGRAAANRGVRAIPQIFRQPARGVIRDSTKPVMDKVSRERAKVFKKSGGTESPQELKIDVSVSAPRTLEKRFRVVVNANLAMAQDNVWWLVGTSLGLQNKGKKFKMPDFCFDVTTKPNSQEVAEVLKTFISQNIANLAPTSFYLPENSADDQTPQKEFVKKEK